MASRVIRLDLRVLNGLNSGVTEDLEGCIAGGVVGLLYLEGLLAILWFNIESATSIRWRVVPMCMLVAVGFWP